MIGSVGTWLTVLALVASATSAVFLGRQYLVATLSMPERQEQTLSRDLQEQRIAELRRSVQQLGAQLSTAEPTNDRALRRLQSRIDAIDGRLTALESAVNSNPERALALPMLRRDIDDLNRQFTERGSAHERQIDRIYDQNKWFIGLMFTMAVGVGSLAISQFLKRN